MMWGESERKETVELLWRVATATYLQGLTDAVNPPEVTPRSRNCAKGKYGSE